MRTRRTLDRFTTKPFIGRIGSNSSLHLYDFLFEIVSFLRPSHGYTSFQLRQRPDNSENKMATSSISTPPSPNNGHTDVTRTILITKIEHKSFMTDGNPIVDLDESSMSALVSSSSSEVDLREACQDCYVRLIKVELPSDPLKSCKDCYVRLSKLQSADLLSTCRQCYVVVPKLNESKLVQ